MFQPIWPGLGIARLLGVSQVPVCFGVRYQISQRRLPNSNGFRLGAKVSVMVRLIVAHRDGLVEGDRREVELRVAEGRGYRR